jgi:hypothetical protein
LKQLYFDAKPSKKIEIQVGGIGFNLGENTEIVTFDVDGYLTGERLILRHPRALFFDEVSATNAYLGDVARPSIFHRLHRMNEANYHQLLVRKQATKMIGFSADYTFWNGTDTFHQAVRARPAKFFLTTLLFESYERASPKGFGFNAFGERVVNKHITVGGGFARLDSRLSLNADKFQPGKRAYGSFTFRPNKEFAFTPFLVQGVGRLERSSTPRTRLDIAFTWNILETMHRHHIL